MGNKKIKVNSKSSLNYKGEVKVDILDGKRIISSRKIKNNGKISLFIFLAQCLTGKYNMAELNRPCYVQLFSVDPDTPEADLFNLQTEWEQKTFPINMSTSPTIDYNSSDTEYAQGAFKFIIPFSQIIDKDNLNLLVLKSQKNVASEDQKEVCAYIYLNDPNRSPLIPDELADDDRYNIFIEWTLSISN